MSTALQKVDHSALRVNQALITGLNILAFVFNGPWLALFVALVMAYGTARRRIMIRAGLTGIVIALLFGGITLLLRQAAIGVSSGNVSGGTVSTSYSGNVTQSNNAALVSVTNHTTGTITFTGTLSATNGSGLQFNNADSTTSYNFNGTNNLNGGDAGINSVPSIL